ncbi:MAG: RNA-guided endonuclease IscB [Ktedonobacterales bacterium]
MAVFVLDQHHHPLMPCSEKRARLLLARRRAVVHRLVPFAIRLRDRRVETSTLQPVVVKLDPGSQTTGIAVVRIDQTAHGEVHHALHLAHLEHRGDQIHLALVKRAGFRRRRRSANLRHRPPRFLNRSRPVGWLPPSLRSRVGNVLTWAKRYQRLAPLTRIEVELVTFDLQLLQNPEISGLAYQRGTLWGWEVRSYVVEKFHHRCGYCNATNVPLELDHVVPHSRGGSDRISNLVSACHPCNTAKGNRTAAEWGRPEVEAQVRAPLKDAAAVNATRYALCDALGPLRMPIATWSGGRTRWNRDRFRLPKDHALDALCVGELAGVQAGHGCTLLISAKGRGSYQRTNVDGSGFPRSYLMRQKRVRGFQTGDLVRAEVPPLLKTAGLHLGRVAVRLSGSFKVGQLDGINARYCQVRQRADGYDYQLADLAQSYRQVTRNSASSPGSDHGASALNAQ